MMILTIIASVVCLALGAFTLSRNPRHASNIAFALGMGALALLEAGDSLILMFYGDNRLSAIGLGMSAAGAAMLPPVWLFFSLVFARANHKEMLSRWFPVLALLSCVSAFFIFWVFSRGIWELQPWFEVSGERAFSERLIFVSSTVGRYFFIYLILGLMLPLVQLENTLRSSTGARRWQIKYVVFGVGSILAFFIYLSSKAVLFSAISLQNLPVTSAVILISTLMMTVFIVRHRLLDVDIFISRYVVYNSVTILAVGLYLLATGVVVYGARYFNVPFNEFFTTPLVFIAFLVLVILLFTAKLRRKVQLFINRHFYKHKYEFRDKWMEAIDRISSKVTVAEIESTLAEMVSETMGAKVFLWVFEPSSRCFVSRSDVEDRFRVIAPSHPVLKLINEHPASGPFLLDEAYGDWTDGLVRAVNATVCAPLVVDREVIGFILQGPDMSGERYRQDDFDLLKAVTTQAAVQIKNTRLAEDILDMKEIEMFSRMSTFIMHDLKNLTNSLSLVSQNAEYNMGNTEFQKDAIRTIDGTVTRMKKLIEKLSTVAERPGARPELSSERADLGEAAGRALQKMALTDMKDVTVAKETDGAAVANVDPEAVEMVVLNLLMNAYEAIEDTGSIKVRAYRENGRACISVADDGPGIPREFIEKDLFKPFKTTKKNGFGIGLFQCKHLVEAQGGTIEVDSRGGGTVFTVSFPLMTGP